jgi:hypothetical protein
MSIDRRDERVRMVTTFAEHHLALARTVPITMALTIAVNTLRMTWHRHAGGPFAPSDRASLEVAVLLCIRLLSAKGAPRMKGGIGSLEGVEESNLAARSPGGAA